MTAISRIVPCIWLDDRAGEAAAFWTAILSDGRVTGTSHYPESGANPAGRTPGSALTVAFTAAGQRFTALNGGPLFRPNPSVSFFVHADTPAQADRLFAGLVVGGEALMPLGAYPWSERYGWAQDRFGVTWQVIAGRRPPGGATIIPCLMFAGAQHGRAVEAMRFWSGLFPDGRVEGAVPYEPGEGPAGTIKHGRFAMAGQQLIAMDSHLSHDIAFSEGLSLQLMCDTQDEVDRCWLALADGGQPGPCGWLKDRFGLSWQIVPTAIPGWMTSSDAAARDRAFAAMMRMGKPDIATLQRAFEGK